MKNNKLQGISSFVIILIIVATLGVGGVASGADMQPEERETTQPEQKVTLNTDDWKTYRNEEYGFEFEYPSTLKGKGLSGQVSVIMSSRYPEDGIKDRFIVQLPYRNSASGKVTTGDGFFVVVTPREDSEYQGLSQGMYLAMKSNSRLPVQKGCSCV